MGWRLAGAAARVAAFKAEMQSIGNTASLETCENDASLCADVRYVAVRLHSEVVERFQWISEPPYCFVHVATPDGARSFLQQYVG